MKAISILTKILATFVMLGCFTQYAFSANAMHIVINNHLGAPEMLIDENRHVVWQAEYDEFGKATILVEEVEFNHRLPGQYYDKETGLHYNYYRDYDPALGRYVESDPIGLAGGINTYGYVGGNPVSYVDPRGLDNATGNPFVDIPKGAALLAAVAVGAAIDYASNPATQKAVSDVINAASDAVNELVENCKDGNDECDKVLDKGLLKAAGLKGMEHKAKEDVLLTNKNLSLFDLCGCKDGKIVVRLHGCKGPIVGEVYGYTWK